MRIFDEDSARDAKVEEIEYTSWLRDQRNRILRMHSTKKKREEWRKIFPPLSTDRTSYLEVGEVF